ncbi:hypothetical protein BpHYR1_037744 [Brachionus plicatilis]|uniref:Uncharacterized protein n=1 Tax=Brachionus plicatilis TaxID=10195 RepID=A0A3M7RCL1_BRAPC|nr:hypothetical protein BpHYR1_037744 [Brachionus plicatilis]
MDTLSAARGELVAELLDSMSLDLIFEKKMAGPNGDLSSLQSILDITNYLGGKFGIRYIEILI